MAETLWQKYRRTAIAEMADWHPGFDMSGVSVSEADREAGSPKEGDKIARNPANHADKWLVAADYFAANFAPLSVPADVLAAVRTLPGVEEVCECGVLKSKHRKSVMPHYKAASLVVPLSEGE